MMSTDVADGYYGFPSMKVPISVVRETLEAWEKAPAPRSWDLCERIILLAQRVFDDPRGWVTRFCNDGESYPHQDNFTKETLAFVCYGKARTYHMSSWRSLISAERQRSEYYGIQSRLPVPLSDIPHDTVNFIKLWCSRKNGIDDMVCTLQTMFGKDHSYDLPKSVSRAIGIEFNH